MRNFITESQLILAIRKHRVVHFNYQNQLYTRAFEPYIIYYSPTDPNKVLVGGTQTKNNLKPLEQPSPLNFEIVDISWLTISDSVFDYDSRFDPNDNEYKNGKISIIENVTK